MVNVSGLQRRSTYAEIERLSQLDEFRDLIKTPDRLPRTIIDAPSMTALEGGAEHEEALIQYEKNKRVEEARRSQVQEIAQQRGVSVAQLELATRPARPQLVEPTSDYERRRYEISLAEAASNFSVAQSRAQNLENVRTMFRDHLMRTYRQRCRGESSIIAKVPSSASWGSTIFHNVSSSVDFVDVGKRNISHISFAIKDASGNTIDLKGASWSLSLVFAIKE